MEYKDYYKIMGVARDASADDIKQAYRRLARKYHPDVSKEKDAERQKADESHRLIAAMKKMHGTVWILDERGKAMTSPAFAKEIEKAKHAGTPMIFVLGGAYGLSDDVRALSQTHLRLSDMVLPHELCRVVFLEQLYRATEIAKGSGYHH